MNNFTAFILGALLAVILVGYVFFGSGDKKDVQPMPVPDMAASVDAATSPDATSAPKEVKESQPESVSKVDDAPAPAPAPAPEASTDTQTSPALETAQDTQISPAPATGDAQPKDTGDVSDAAPVQDQTDTTAQQS
ncbi:MAG: hypothetical protein P8L77_04520 [Gammaproteobacteria bacterium]|nr:hypothetical protein [Gammaproteobacteria bacterium]